MRIPILTFIRYSQGLEGRRQETQQADDFDMDCLACELSLHEFLDIEVDVEREAYGVAVVVRAEDKPARRTRVVSVSFVSNPLKRDV